MVRNQVLDIAHYVLITLMGVCSKGEKAFAVVMIDGGRMGMQHERDGQKTFDPFNLGSSAFSPCFLVCLCIPRACLPAGPDGGTIQSCQR